MGLQCVIFMRRATSRKYRIVNYSVVNSKNSMTATITIPMTFLVVVAVLCQFFIHLHIGAFTCDVRCFGGIFDLSTYPNQILYYISLFSRIRCSLTYLTPGPSKSEVVMDNYLVRLHYLVLFSWENWSDFWRDTTVGKTWTILIYLKLKGHQQCKVMHFQQLQSVQA